MSDINSMLPLTLEQMRADIAHALGVPASEVADDDFLPDLGLDSIRAMMLLERWTKNGQPIEFSALAERGTLGEWAEMLCG